MPGMRTCPIWFFLCDHYANRFAALLASVVLVLPHRLRSTPYRTAKHTKLLEAHTQKLVNIWSFLRRQCLALQQEVLKYINRTLQALCGPERPGAVHMRSMQEGARPNRANQQAWALQH
jgi:hypothetical protein